MGLDIWFAEDIRNALLAANEASAATAAVIADVRRGPSTSSGQGPSTLRQVQGSGQSVTDSTELLAVSLRAYREGYKAALTTVALAFGIAPQAITLQPLEELGTIQAQDKALGLGLGTQSLSAAGSQKSPTCHLKREGSEESLYRLCRNSGAIVVEKASPLNVSPLGASRSGEEP